MSQLADRKLVELRQKLRALGAEFERWREQSEAGRPAQGHHSQVRAITATLTGLRNGICERMEALAETPNLVAESANLQRLILAIYRVWEFFRAKLDQRSVPAFRDYLAGADELAWQCYGPLRKLVYPDMTIVPGKEPPLVFLNGGWSPFVARRATAFQAEDVSREFINDRSVKKVLESQPISVIGVPWYQIAHLPDALVILHETGHLVEADFGLTQQLQRLCLDVLCGSDRESRRSQWLKWLPEVFADLYGCLVGGPTYAETLLDFLASRRTEIETEISTDHGEYPSAYLRVLLAAAALMELDFKTEASRIENDWRRLYPTHAMANFESDLRPIANSIICGCTLRDQKLVDIVAFTRRMQDGAEYTYERLKDGMPPAQTNVRILFATARLAFQIDPLAYVDRNWGRELLNALTGASTPEWRARGEALDDSGEDMRDALLIALGSDLCEELLSPG
jgi:hypothetical protein